MQYKKTIHAVLRRLLTIIFAVILSTPFAGCESVSPRPDISVKEMERTYLSNQADFNAVQKLIGQLFPDEPSDVSDRSTIRIARTDADAGNTDGTMTESLTITTFETSISEDQRLALLKAAEPLFEQSPILCIFANDIELYFYFYEEWGYEHYLAYREDGSVPGGSFGTIQDSKEIAPNWYSVIAHD